MKLAIVAALLLCACGYEPITPEMYHRAEKACESNDGLANVVTYSGGAFVAKAFQGGETAEIIGKLNRETTAILRSAEMKTYLGNYGAEPMPGTAQEADNFIRNEAKRWRKVMADAGVKAE